MPATIDGQPSRARVLVNRGRSLLQHGGTALEHCEIYDGAELYLLPEMQIFIKTLTGETRPCPSPCPRLAKISARRGLMSRLTLVNRSSNTKPRREGTQ